MIGFLLLASPARPSAKLRILTTVFPLQEFAARIAGERGDVELLLPPGAGPHTWQPRPGDLVRLAKADLVLAVGAGLEPWLAGLVRGIAPSRVKVIELSQGLPLLAAEGRGEDEPAAENEHREGGDPHVWLDFELAARIVDRIAAELTAADPAGQAVFRARAQALRSDLGALDDEFRAGLAACAGRILVVAGHAAFGYLARRYGLKQVALYGPSPEAQPRPRAVVEVVEEARRQGVQVVFYETSVASDLARAIAREIGARTLALNAGHNPTRAELMRGRRFFDIMRTNLERLRDGLGCR
ncbi:MAG: zinc ABC transporter substrate-binding protein [Candidatus Aminicenantes bacterium]|nr:zinc ABC transporter substrate-binding protein [Candidatus Aminicenantes bacterium]